MSDPSAAGPEDDAAAERSGGRSSGRSPRTRAPRPALRLASGLVRPAVLVLLGASVAWTLADAGAFAPERAARSLRNVFVFLGDMVPPDTDGDLLALLVASLWETVRMAWAGTLLGAILALPAAMLAASNLAPRWVSLPVRGLLAMVRTIPSILWAVFMVVIVGLGPFAGILALTAYTTGYLGKLYYEAIEAIDPETLDAVRATGASTLQLARHVALPEAGNALLSQSLFAFEYNVRASTILGLVGAGGVGFYLLRFIELFEYQKLATTLVLLYALVVAVDAASGRLRRRFLARRA